ncbi:transmembrane channel-like protein 7 [Mya arenaria]|uniref:transmembrane channel-like protein 7 n=1 Tax=Mya arenaria TaxID=6604 RepID=UPI0022E0FA02|nr:transmembrane channel-like protein 7 [Mya arenaria]
MNSRDRSRLYEHTEGHSSVQRWTGGQQDDQRPIWTGQFDDQRHARDYYENEPGAFVNGALQIEHLNGNGHEPNYHREDKYVNSDWHQEQNVPQYNRGQKDNGNQDWYEMDDLEKRQRGDVGQRRRPYSDGHNGPMYRNSVEAKSAEEDHYYNTHVQGLDNHDMQMQRQIDIHAREYDGVSGNRQRGQNNNEQRASYDDYYNTEEDTSNVRYRKGERRQNLGENEYDTRHTHYLPRSDGYERSRTEHTEGMYEASDDVQPHRTPRSRGHGFDNQGFEQDEDFEEEKEKRAIMRRVNRSMRYKSSKRRRTRRFQDNDDHNNRLSFADGFKTLIRKKNSIHHDSRSPFDGARSSIMGSGIYSNSVDSDSKLPSNRNVKKTKSLKYRLQHLKREKGELKTEDRADALRTINRDQIVSHESSSLEGWEMRKYQIAMSFLHFKNWVKSWLYQLELWAGAFKIIEGHFGQATVSYFRFLRWLLFLNLFLTIFMITVVLMPFLLLPTASGDNLFKASVNECTSLYHYEAVYFSGNYTDFVEESIDSGFTSQSVLDILQGTGWLENTVLFYGGYFNRTSRLPIGDSFTYDMSLAYLCAVGVGYILSFILLVKNSAKGMKQSVLTSVSGSGVNMYCDKVFGAWDFCISQQKTAQLKHKSIRQEIMNELEYQRLQWKKDSRTTREKLKLYTIRFLVNVLVIAILSGALYLIYFTNQKLVELQHKGDLDSSVLLIVQYLPSITITLLSVIVPIIFNKLVIAEDYMPAFAIRITLIRTVLLRLSSLAMLVFSLYGNLSGKKPDADISDQYNATCLHQTDDILNPVNVSPVLNTEFACWETYVGQQIYKLVFLNFIVVIAVTFAWEFPRKLLVTRFSTVKLFTLLGQQQFDLSKCVLDLVYLQTLCWIGMFFSPIIPAMCLATCFVFFYVKKGSLLQNCLPVQQYGTSKSNSLFMMVLLLSFILALAPISYMVGKISPSKGCGPFRVFAYENYIMFDVVTNMVDRWPTEAREVFFFMSTPGFMAIAGILLCMLMYYYWIVGQAHENMSKTLKEQLKIEGQDKQFLVARLHETFEYSAVQ